MLYVERRGDVASADLVDVVGSKALTTTTRTAGFARVRLDVSPGDPIWLTAARDQGRRSILPAWMTSGLRSAPLAV